MNNIESLTFSFQSAENLTSYYIYYRVLPCNFFVKQDYTVAVSAAAVVLDAPDIRGLGKDLPVYNHTGTLEAAFYT